MPQGMFCEIGWRGWLCLKSYLNGAIGMYKSQLFFDVYVVVVDAVS